MTLNNNPRELHLNRWFNIGFDDTFTPRGTPITRTQNIIEANAWIKGRRAAIIYKRALRNAAK